MIHKATIRNYMGITFREIELPAGGVVIEGGNARGKTSLLKALNAALTGAGIDPSCIHKDADKAELIVELDDATIRRVIPRDGRASLKITRPGNLTQGAPASFLATIFGATLDPLAFYFAKPDERRAMLLDAMPCEVTPARIRGWVPELTTEAIGKVLGVQVADDDALPMHGLVAIEKIHDSLYANRTGANKAAKAARADADQAAAAQKTSEGALAALVPDTDAADIVTVNEAVTDQARAEEAVRALEQRAGEHARAEARAGKARTMVAARKQEAAAAREAAPAVPTPEVFESARNAIGAARDVLDATRARVVELERLLAEARSAQAAAAGEEEKARAVLDVLHAQKERAEAAEAKAADLERQAADLESAIEVPPAPTDEERAVARAAVVEAEQVVQIAQAAAAVLQRREATAAAERTAAAAKAQADAIDRAVKTMATTAPTELLDGAKGIPGVSISGDTIMLEGVAIDRLSGAEQMKLAVDIARRANVKSKVLIVDGIERIDGDELEAFTVAATADGYQVIATRVTRGDIQVQPIGEGAAS